jgi:hypothetical protein
MSKLLNTVFALYLISVTCAVSYFNWQFAKEHGFWAWAFLGEIVPTAKAVIWPYYAFGGGKGTQPTEESQAAWPPLNAAELDVASRVAGKAMNEPLSEQDLRAVREMCLSYEKRVGRKMEPAHLAVLSKLQDKTNDYNQELGRCLLMSIDSKAPFVSEELRRLRKEMESTGLVDKAKLDDDFAKITAAGNGTEFTDRFGKSYYPTTREDVLTGLGQLERVHVNMDSMYRAFEECSRR